MSFVTCNVYGNIIKHEPALNKDSKKTMLFGVGIGSPPNAMQANIDKA
jgi:hypothetical protein